MTPASLASWRISPPTTSTPPSGAPRGLEALDKLGKQGADGIRRVLAEKGIDQGDVYFVGHGPLTVSTAYHLAGNTSEARAFCLACPANEGSRFIVEGEDITFVPLSSSSLA